MPTLLETQKALHDFLQGKSSDIEKYVVGKNPTEVQRRLGIYQEAYQLRLLENLRKQYPVLANYLAEEKFTELAKQYHDHYLPTGFAIRRYGASMAEHLAQTHQELLSELASFEWAMNEALDESADLPLLTKEALQKLAPEMLFDQHFTFHPSLRRLNFSYDIPNFWQALKKSPRAAAPQRLADPIYYVIWRQALIPYYHPVDQLEWTLLEAAHQQATFADLCERAAETLPEDVAANTVAQTVFRWVQYGWLVVE